MGEGKSYSEEQIQKALETDIVDYAVGEGFDVENADKNQKSYRIKDMGGLYLFRNGGFHCFSDETKGSIIKFAMKYQALTFVEAIGNITGEAPYQKYDTKYEKTYVHKPMSQEKTVEKKPLVLPKKDGNTNEIEEYLTVVRQLDQAIVKDLIASGDIFQAVTQKDKYTFRNCAFVSFDEKREAKACSLRSIAVGSKFRQEYLNSDKSYAFAMNGKSERLFVFEAPIDAISHATLRKLNGIDYTKDSRISVGGLNDRAIERYLKTHTHIKEIVFCFDNDKDSAKNVGQEFAKKCYQKYNQRGFQTYVEKPKNKDFNEDLLKLKQAVQERKSMLDRAKQYQSQAVPKNKKEVAL